MTLQKRLVGALSFFVILPMVIALGIGYYFLQHQLEGFIVERLEGATQQKVAKVEEFFNIVQTDLETIKSSTEAIATFKTLYSQGYQPGSAVYRAAAQRLDAVLTPIRLKGHYEDVKYVLDDKRDQVIYVNNPDYSTELGKPESSELDTVVKAGGAGMAFSDVFKMTGTSPVRYGMYVASNVADQDKLTIGVLVIMLDVTPVFTEVTNTLGLSTSGESFLLKDDGYSALYLTPLKHDPAAALTRRQNYGDDSSSVADEAARGRIGSGKGVDYRGKNVIAAWAPVSGLPWAVETKIDHDEALGIAKNMRGLALLATLAIFVSVMTIVWVIVSRMVERPLRTLEEVADELARGQDTKVDAALLYQNNEFGKLANSLHHLANRMQYPGSNPSDPEPNDRHHPRASQ